MSIFYDPKAKKPQIWTFIFLLMIPVVIFVVIYMYGDQKAKQMSIETQPTKAENIK